MSTFTTECPMCKKCFKTLYSVKKHIGEKHQGEEGTITPRFKDCKGVITPLPKPRSVLDPGSVEGYKMWLAGLIERLNSTFHPRLPGRWIKVDCHQVPKTYFEYFLSKAQVEVNSVREVCHKRPPCYQAKTRKISYKMFDVELFFDALEESEVVFNTEVLFVGNLAFEEEETPLSAEEEILRAKQRAGTRSRPSSKSTLIVGYGEGRATREIEFIWWPDLYNATKHGRLVIRMYIEKCEF